LAGLPAAAVARAEEVLAKLEAGEQGGAIADLATDLPLFAAAVKPARGALEETRAAAPSAVEAALAGVNPDELSPREALEALYRLKALLADRQS
ncbi:MAG: hypothetical protein U1F20_11045, partial [Lysobacterales bacterium]